jgi:hypothetical protein
MPQARKQDGTTDPLKRGAESKKWRHDGLQNQERRKGGPPTVGCRTHHRQRGETDQKQEGRYLTTLYERGMMMPKDKEEGRWTVSKT